MVDDDGNDAMVETFSNKVAELNAKHNDAGPKRFTSHPKYKSYKQKVSCIRNRLLSYDMIRSGMFITQMKLYLEMIPISL